jgi:hypothetical protein
MRARRSTVVDEYAEDGQVAVYSASGMVVVLSELAGVAWESLGEDWTTAEELAAALVQVFGEPPEGHTAVEMTEHALRTLEGHGLVELDEA